MKIRKIAIAASVVLVGVAAHAQTAPTLQDDLQSGLATLLGNFTATTGGPDISVLSGAVNSAALKGNIDISGVNVGLSSMAANVSANATATATTSTANAYAIAGAKLSTTVIGAMNSATVDLMAKTTDQSSAMTGSLGAGSLAAQNGSVAMAIPDFTNSLGTITNGISGTSNILNATSGTNLDVANLTSSVSNTVTNKVSELQAMNVFNGAINVSANDASIKIAAATDPKAWFLNPQTGVVNLSNIEMATTNIGAMNSSLTRLGVSFPK